MTKLTFNAKNCIYCPICDIFESVTDKNNFDIFCADTKEQIAKNVTLENIPKIPKNCPHLSEDNKITKVYGNFHEQRKKLIY